MGDKWCLLMWDLDDRFSDRFRDFGVYGLLGAGCLDGLYGSGTAARWC